MLRFARSLALIIPLLSIALPARALSLLDPFNIPGTLDGGVRVENNIAFMEGERGGLDLYLPEEVDGTAPVVVFIYGGAWQIGSKADYPFAGHALAAQGFVTVIPDYRLYPEVQYPDFLMDNARAIKWVEDNIARYGGDPKRLFLVGHSAGAYAAVTLGMDSSFLREQKVTIPIRAVVGLAGPYSVYPFEFKELQEAFGNVDNPQATQPVNLPTNEAVPMLLLQGAKDTIVSPDNTVALQQKLVVGKGSVEAKIYDGLGHMEILAALSQVWRWRDPVLADIVTYLTERGAFDPESFGPIDLVGAPAPAITPPASQ